jgi:hypothetical protein
MYRQPFSGDDPSAVWHYKEDADIKGNDFPMIFAGFMYGLKPVPILPCPRKSFFPLPVQPCRNQLSPCLSTPLPPRFGLDSVRQTIRSIQVRRPSYKTTKSVRPVRISDENTYYRPTEKLAACSDLRR